MDAPISLWHIIELLATGLLGVLMWIGKTLHNALAVRVEDLEDTTVHKDTFADVRKLMEEHRTETRNQFNNVQQTLNTILIKVGESNRD